MNISKFEFSKSTFVFTGILVAVALQMLPVVGSTLTLKHVLLVLIIGYFLLNIIVRKQIVI